VRPLFERIGAPEAGSLHTLVLAPDIQEAFALRAELAAIDARCPVHTVTGLARSGKRLQAGSIRTLVTTPADALQLLTRSALSLHDVQHVVVCWPEAHATLDRGPALDEILGESGAAQRLVVTADPAICAEFLERHARRAPTLTASRPPTAPTGSVRYAIAPPSRSESAVRDLLDALSPGSVHIWDPTAWAAVRWSEHEHDPTVAVTGDVEESPVDLAVAVDLPTVEALTALRQRARDIVVLLGPTQLHYLRTLVTSATSVRIRSEADRALDWRTALRARVRERLEGDRVDGTLVALAPLFDEYDPALLAAAVLELPEDEAPRSKALDGVPVWVHIHLNLGRRDGLRPADVVGALLNAAGLNRDDIGRVDIRDAFCVVEVRAEEGERAQRGLDGIMLRGRTAQTRFDRK
jgi:hypothetical protein